MDGKFAFLLLFSKHLEHKAKYKRRRRVSNMILMKMLQEKNIYAHQNLVRFFCLPDTRRYWMIKYGQSWFDRLWNHRDNELFKKTWKKEFRFSLETFYFIMKLVQDKMEKSDTSFRKAVPLEKRVAVVLWRLATGN